MTIEDVTLRVIDALNAAAVPHLLVGSFASNLYGIPRATKDADFVVQAEGGSLDRLFQLLSPEFAVDPQLKFETNTGTYKQEMSFRGTPFTVEVFHLSNDPFDQERYRRRLAAKLFGRQTFVPTAEDVVVMKLRWFRQKDRDDIRGVMAVQRGKLDWRYIEAWGSRHGTLALLEDLRRFVPEI
jgi:hypothetical protein